MTRSIGLLALLLLFGLPRTVNAQVLIPNEPADAQPLRVNSQEVKVSVQDRVSVTTINQEFYNPTSRTITGTYVFPMPREATITQFTYWVKGKEIRARLMGRNEAEKRFVKATASGRGAAMLQDVDKITFQCRISPIMPDTVTRVRIEYVQVLPYARNEVTLILPLQVLGLLAPVAALKVQVDVHDQLPIEKFSSPSHPDEVRFKSQGANAFTANFAPGAGELPPILKLSYRLKPDGMGATLLTFREKGKPGYFLLQLAPTSADTRDTQVPREMTFVFDRSGSMAGEKIQQAKRALHLGLDGLRPGDRFGLIAYDNVIERFRPQLTSVTDETLQEARVWVDALTDRSGTNLHDALIEGLRFFGPSEAQRLVVFLTDGLPTVGITDKEQIIRDVTAANRNDVRIFSWAFGKDADDGLLARISNQNFATAEHYSADEVIEAKMRAFYHRAGHPILLNPKLDFGATVSQVIPGRLPDLYHGVSLQIVGRYEEDGKGGLVISGTQGKETKRTALGPGLPESDTRYPFIAQLWARARAAELVRSIRTDGEQQSLVEEVVRLSKQYSILTPYTTYYAEPPKDRQNSQASGSGALPPPSMLGQTRFAVAGDPRILVTAPSGTRAVVALLPWGDRFDLVQLAGSERWSGRFIVPSGTPDGNYQVRLMVLNHRGGVSWRSLQFSAAVTSPDGVVESSVERVKGGWKLGVTVRVQPGVAQVFAVVPGLPALSLRRVAGREYFGQVFVRGGVAPRSVRVVLLDAAHNRKELPVLLKTGR